MLAVDTGGTFTDLVLLADGSVRALKVPSTPGDPAEAVLAGSRALLGREGRAGVLSLGSTVATNALLEGKGARVGLVTNAGFEDILEIGRQDRPQLYALVGHRPPPLVPRERRVGIRGRLDSEGGEVEPLDPDELAALRERFAGCESLAVALLHSYADPAHERRVAEALQPLGLPVSVSSQVLPEYREYERTSTTVVNAYVLPLMAGYLGRIDRESPTERIRVMGSNGGVLSAARAAREPVHTVLSGPAAGVVGALFWARVSGLARVLSFDMGGTSTDVSLCPGRALHTREFTIGGHPVSVPVIDIHTVGAGGGSIARTDAGGALRVGPESSGAVPGPICYGQGAAEVTVTDAHVWLGRLPVDAFLGGERRLDRAAVEPALRGLADQAGLDPDRSAAGVLEVAETTMVGALRVISVERGFDPQRFTLVAFGGAGGLHAAALAGAVGAGNALIPPDPGLLSAYGMLAAPITSEVSRSVLRSTADPELEEVLAEAFRDTDGEAAATVVAEAPDADVVVERWIDARYVGQSFELRIPEAGWRDGFARAHQARYGYGRPHASVEVVTVRSVGRAVVDPPQPPRIPDADDDPPFELRPVWTGEGFEPTRVLARSSLRHGHRIEGPAVVTDYSGTTWIPVGWSARVDAWGGLHLGRGAGS